MAITLTKRVASTEQRATLAEIREHILAVAETASEDNVIEVVAELDQGKYFVDEPLVFSAEENPALKNIRLTVKAKPSMRPTVSGIRRISGAEFTPVEGMPYYKYQFEKDENGEYPKFRDFFLGDKRLTMAKSPVWRNPVALLPEHRKGEMKMDGLYAPVGIAERIKESGIGATQLRMFVQWEHYILCVTDVDPDTTMDVDGEPYVLVKLNAEFDEFFVRGMHRANNIGNRETFFVNNLAFLTEPDTFVYDWKAGTVYVLPADAANMARHSFGYTTLSNYLVFKGMKDVTVEGIDFVGLTSPYACDTGYFGRLSNYEMRAGRLRHAAILTSDMRNMTVKRCCFRALGCNGVQVCDKTVGLKIEDCVFKDTAMSAIAIGNYRTDGKVGNGWKQGEETFFVKVRNNYFEHIAYDYPSTACIFLGFCDGGELSHNTVRGCGYSAIAAGDGYSQVSYYPGEKVNLRNVEIAYNDIRDFMDVCRDGAAIYVTGANCTKDYAPRFNSIHHNAAFLTESGHRDRRGYYLDGSASNWDVYDNVIDNCQLPLFTQYHVPGQYTHHNRLWNIYSTTDIEPQGNHKPNHDTLLGFWAVEKDLDTLYEKHPHAKEIADGAGYRDTGVKTN